MLMFLPSFPVSGAPCARRRSFSRRHSQGRRSQPGSSHRSFSAICSLTKLDREPALTVSVIMIAVAVAPAARRKSSSLLARRLASGAGLGGQAEHRARAGEISAFRVSAIRLDRCQSALSMSMLTCLSSASSASLRSRRRLELGRPIQIVWLLPYRTSVMLQRGFGPPGSRPPAPWPDWPCRLQRLEHLFVDRCPRATRWM